MPEEAEFPFASCSVTVTVGNSFGDTPDHRITSGPWLNVPIGTSIEIARRMDLASVDDLISFSHYTVKNGDTLAAVARKLHISRSDLAEANDMSASAGLTAGQQLMVPAGVPYVSYAPPAKANKSTAAPARKTQTTSKKK